MLRYKRVLLKLSGEALMGVRVWDRPGGASGYRSRDQGNSRARSEVAIVIGGGNIFRGITATKYGVDRVTADYMGMLATVMNGLALQGAAGTRRVAARLQTAIEMHQVAEPYIRRRAIRHLEKGRVVIFAGAMATLLHYGHNCFPPGGGDRRRSDLEGNQRWRCVQCGSHA